VTWRAQARFASALGRLACWSPRAAFLLSDAVAELLALRSRRPSRAQVRSLFPARRDAARIVRRVWRTHVRTIAMGGWLRRGGITDIRALVRPNPAVDALRPPMVVGTFHIGPTFGLSALTERLQGEKFVLRGTQFPAGRNRPANVQVVAGTDQQRAAVFHRALLTLRNGGFVIVALDPQEAQRIAVPFLGHTMQLARGPFAMARIARVPVVPVVARWDGDAIDLIVGDAFPPGEEQEMAADAGAWLERYLTENPGELSYRILELMD
jgi:lauroyl/myristoyl acyltransferase